MSGVAWRIDIQRLEAAVCFQKTDSCIVTVCYKDVALPVRPAEHWQFESDWIDDALFSMDFQ